MPRQRFKGVKKETLPTVSQICQAQCSPGSSASASGVGILGMWTKPQLLGLLREQEGKQSVPIHISAAKAAFTCILTGRGSQHPRRSPLLKGRDDSSPC